jgi:hypothetical protein
MLPLREPDRAVLSHAKRLAQSLAEVVGIDYGFVYKKGRKTTRKGFRFHTRRKKPPSLIKVGQRIPKVLGGIACDVIEARYEPHGEQSPLRTISPIRPGISIGNVQRRTTGTLGAIVRDRLSGDRCILSNWHVLAGSLQPGNAEPIGQPGPEHFGFETPPIVAELTRWTNLSHGIDAAIAKIKSNVQIDLTIFDENVNFGAPKEPRLDMHLCKFGAISEFTHAVIDGVDGSFLLDYSRYGDQPRWMDAYRLVPDTNHREDEISLAGDSGALWYDPTDNRPVALHLGGEDGLGPLAEYALAHPLERALELLQVELIAAHN